MSKAKHANMRVLGEPVMYFSPYTGLVLVKQLRALSDRTVIKNGNIYSRSLENAVLGGDVDLF